MVYICSISKLMNKMYVKYQTCGSSASAHILVLVAPEIWRIVEYSFDTKTIFEYSNIRSNTGTYSDILILIPIFALIPYVF